MQALCDRWSVDEPTLRELDDLKRTPIVASMPRLARVLMLDKILIGGMALLAFIVFVFLFGLAWGTVAGVGGALAGVGLMSLSGRGRIVDPAAPLKLIPERILKQVDADYVVFGHTHKPVRMSVPGGVYFNTGTWLPSGKPGLLRAFTHVVVERSPSGARAELCQWRDGGSRPFAHAGYGAEGERAEAEVSAGQESPAASTGLPR